MWLIFSIAAGITVVLLIFFAVKAAIRAALWKEFENDAWNDFLAPLVYLVGHEELWPISVGMSYFSGQYQQLPHLIQATALMALALPLAIFMLAQKVFVQGVVVTGVDK